MKSNFTYPSNISYARIKLMSRIPVEFKKYFWDTSLENIDLEVNKIYIIERLLEHGDLSACRWLIKTYSKKDLISTLKTSRNLSAKSANFWAILYDIPKKEIKCLNKQLTQTQETAWPY